MIGKSIGPYQILAELGRGGMGEVYRAKDTKLNRDVAIKVLPESFALDADRVARFSREAQVLASLNHPNIAAIYGIEESGNTRALVMELVEGDDLSVHIARGAMPLSEALPIAKQIADALEAAHEQGVVHRDLKPQNIKVRADGTVKVLDFGLAKALDRTLDSGPGTLDAANSPTLTVRGTQMGMIIGTAAYMAPEQARGRAVDRRADIWAFGVVLYEMLTGRRAFEGEDISITLANVMKDDVAWDALPKDLPPPIARLLRRCLEKDPKKRLRDIGEARLILEDPMAAQSSGSSSVVATPAPATLRVWQVATALLALVVIGGGALWVRAPGVATVPVQFTIAAPDKTAFISGASRAGAVPAISPDGRMIAFTAVDASGQRRLWVRPIESLNATPLAGTEGAGWPFWSPDSRTIAYSAKATLMKIAASGGPAITICSLHPNISARGGTWNRDNVVVFNNGPAPLYRVSSSGGVAAAMGALQPGEGGRQFPVFLPDQHHFLYNVAGNTGGSVWVGSIDGNETKQILQADTGAVYDARMGLLLFGRQGTLMAQSFDPKTFALAGEAFPVAEHLESANVPGVVAFSISDTGVLVYGVGTAATAGLELTWLDRRGQKTGTVGPIANYRGIDLSPDGTRLATHRHDGDGGDIWITDLATNASSRLTFNADDHNASPAWSPDGKRIAFASHRAGKFGLYVKNADNTGDEMRLFDDEFIVGAMGPQPSAWTVDGRAVLFSMMKSPATGTDVWLASVSADHRLTPLLTERFYERFGQFSPDGKWIAYQSNETGSSDIYIRPASGTGGKWSVSTSGGTAPRWRADGRELFYTTVGNLYAVDVVAEGTTLRLGTPKLLFQVNMGNQTHDDAFPYVVRKDGQAFLVQQMASASGTANQTSIVVALNWAAGIKK